MSPDGTSAYSASYQGSAVVVYDRTPDGTLTQKAGTAGCVSSDGGDFLDNIPGVCAVSGALTTPSVIAISPDGKNVYVANYTGGIVVVFDRAANGTLTQKAGTAGCISDDGSGGSCVDGTAIDLVRSIAVSPDGTNVYITCISAVAVFDRAANGALTQKVGTAGGCLSDDLDPGTAEKPGTAVCITQDGKGSDGTAGLCVDGKALDRPADVTVSPDGKSVYVAVRDSHAVAVFDRAANGTLTQKPGAAGCVSNDAGLDGCTQGAGLSLASAVTVSPDGATVYATADGSSAVTAYARSADGTLTPRPSSCIAQSLLICLRRTEALNAPVAVTTSPDGQQVYVAAGAGVTTLEFVTRGPTTPGELVQRPRPAGCIARTGTPDTGACTPVRPTTNAFDSLDRNTISPDGTSVYVTAFNGNAVLVFDRDTNGTLT